jgi:UDP-galactopyranose mutase
MSDRIARPPTNSPLVVFSHLRWDFVYQRPQHVMSRLARDRRVLFVEEPVRVDDAAPRWERDDAAPNLTVLRPLTPVASPGFGGMQHPILSRMLRALLAHERVGSCIAWLYTPMALPLARAVGPDAIVYDCMDELSAFLGAPAELVERETALLGCADVVFTGGPSLHRAKRARHPSVHCFPSSVDRAHFALARDGIAEPHDQRDLPRPRLGFFGVLDERLDAPLLATLADRHADWQLVMVGPVVKIDPASLPRRPSIHYLGARRYEDLPSYVTGWDVCLLPFARNTATRFISPTKTLEYMAAGRPIASTAIADVAEPYAGIVHLGDGPAGFAAACERALAAGDAERVRRQQLADAVLARTSWDRTVAAMADILAELAAPTARVAGRGAAS